MISTPELALPNYVKDIMNAAGCNYVEVSSLSEAMPMLDVLYMTRIQQERFATREQYEAQKGVYVLDREKLNMGKRDLKVLHPLPRVDEITPDVDEDPRAAYFKQTVYGMYARMALIFSMLMNPQYKRKKPPRYLRVFPPGGMLQPQVHYQDGALSAAALFRNRRYARMQILRRPDTDLRVSLPFREDFLRGMSPDGLLLSCQV